MRLCASTAALAGLSAQKKEKNEYKPFYHKLADKLSKSEGKDDVYACLSRRGVNEKRQTNRKPDYSQITRRGSGDHYSVFNRGAESDDVVNDLIIELLNPMKHNNTSSDA